MKHLGRPAFRSVGAWAWARMGAILVMIVLPAALLGSEPAETKPAGTTTLRRGDVVVAVAASPQQATVAQPITVTVRVEAPAGSRVTLPTPANRLGRLEIVTSDTLRDIPLAQRPDRRRWTRQWTVESLQTGSFDIPSFEITVTQPSDPSSSSGDRQPQQLVTQPVEVRVVSVLTEADVPTRYRPLKDVVDLPAAAPQQDSGLWKWVVAGVLFVVLLAAGLCWRRRRVPLVSPQEWALAELDLLESHQATADEPSVSATPAQQLAQLASTLRQFLEWEYGWNANQRLLRSPDETEHQDAWQHNLDAAARDEYFAILVRADTVRFAPSEIERSELDQLVQRARRLIRGERVTVTGAQKAHV